MYTVKFKCPNKIVANALALLTEEGAIQKLVNERLSSLDMLEGNKLTESATPEFDDSDYPDHEVELSED
jgi:hypothetical protein